MRKLIFITMVCAFLAGPVLAGPMVKIWYGASVDAYRIQGPAGGGGEFTAELVSGWTYDVLELYDDKTKDETHSPSFQTFCLELHEGLMGDGYTYDVTLNDNAVYGGVGPGGDPISKGTAYLYLLFATDTLIGYNYSTAVSPSGDTYRELSALVLQKAIWSLEDEIADLTGTGNIFYDAAISEFGTLANAKLANADLYPVKAMNLTDSNLDLYQDHLVLVPLPAAVLLGILGLSVAGIKLRKYA